MKRFLVLTATFVIMFNIIATPMVYAVEIYSDSEKKFYVDVVNDDEIVLAVFQNNTATPIQGATVTVTNL